MQRIAVLGDAREIVWIGGTHARAGLDDPRLAEGGVQGVGGIEQFHQRAGRGWAGIVGWQALVDQQATVDALLKVGIPQEYTSWLGWGTGIGLLVIAFFVLVGLRTRIFAALMLAGVAGFLAFFRFGPFSPFLEGHFGFYGDRDVFLAVLCLLLVLLGAGGWSVDANMRRRRKSAAKPE